MKAKPNFAAFASASRKTSPQRGEYDQRRVDVKHLQVRLLKADAIRLRRVAEQRDKTIQAALVEAINLYFRDENEPPAPDPGTGSGE